MSKSPKALLPSRLSLASLSRALPGSSAAVQGHAVAFTSTGRRASAETAGRGTRNACIVVRQRRPASSLAERSPSQSTTGAEAAAGRQITPSASGAYRAGYATASGSGALLRRAHTVAGPSSATVTRSRSANGFLDPGTSYAVAGPSSGARYFHSSRCPRHQQAVSPASGGITPPPGPGSAGSGGHSGHGSSSVDGSFHPKHHSSLPLSSHDGPLLPGAVAPGSGSGTSLPTTLDPSSSKSPASSSQTAQHNAPSTAVPATLFSHPPPASLPSHALPAFFGSALNIARRSNLVFRNGAYGIPKTDYHRARSSVKGKEKAVPPVDESEHDLSVGVGEDSYFLRPDSLGVADGVGGWSGHAGANSARWARKFMHHCSAELARYENVDDEMFLHYYDVDPVEVMQRAYEKTLSECKEEVRRFGFSPRTAGAGETRLRVGTRG